MNASIRQSLDVLADQGTRLNSALHLPWSASIQQSVHRLRFGASVATPPQFVAVVGGASSGKSTVFNNLLGGNAASRITAKGHCTIGPIVVAHEDDRQNIQAWLAKKLLLPDRTAEFVELDDNVTGDPNTISIAFHSIDALSGTLLFDTPDFTSEAASLEGDVSMSLLPWFDRLIVVVDHERWFDRQNVTELRRESRRFDHDRMVLFNRTREEELAASDEAALQQQAQRLEAEAMSVLEFRRGRGLSLFAPGTLDRTVEFMSKPPKDRATALLCQISDSANQVLNQNEERHARLEELKASLTTTVDRTLPSVKECMTSLMLPEERRQLEVAYRVLRIQETTEWIKSQQSRLRRALGNVPIVGSLVRAGRDVVEDQQSDSKDRASIAKAYAESLAKKMSHEVQWSLASSSFWDEIRRWTGLEPRERLMEWSPQFQEEVLSRARDVDESLKQWTDKVESECQGIAPRVQGAIGVGAIAIAVVLIAVPGPVAALTLVSAKGAIAGVIGKLVAATGVGALAGKQAGRLSSVIREKLLGSEEFNAVHAAAAAFRNTIEVSGRTQVAQAMTESSALVLDVGDPLIQALGTVRGPEAS